MTQATKIAPAPPTQSRRRPAARPKTGATHGRKVKILRREGGRYSYIVAYKDVILYLSPERFRSVGDAKSAGKAFIRTLPQVWLPHPISALNGKCKDCLAQGKPTPAADKKSFLCRQCRDQSHPAQRTRSGAR